MVLRHAKLQGRTDQMCKKRWLRHLDPRKSPASSGVKWTTAEDKALATAVAAHTNEHAKINWKQVQQALKLVLPRRTSHPTPDNLRWHWRKIINNHPEHDDDDNVEVVLEGVEITEEETVEDETPENVEVVEAVIFDLGW